MVGGGVGGLRAGARVLQLHLQAAGAARAPAAGRARARPAPQRHLPHLQVRARLLRVLLPQRRRLLHRGHLRQPHLQLRVPQRLRGPALRVQGPGRLLRAHQPPPHDGDGLHRGRRHRGRVPGHSSLLRRVGAPAPPRQGASAARARPGAARGRGGAPGPRAPVSRGALVPRALIDSPVYIVLDGPTGRC